MLFDERFVGISSKKASMAMSPFNSGKGPPEGAQNLTIAKQNLILTDARPDPIVQETHQDEMVRNGGFFCWMIFSPL